MEDSPKINSKKTICDHYNIELTTFDRWMDSYGLTFIKKGEDQEFTEAETNMVRGLLEKLFNNQRSNQA